ncbi:MAG: DNA repair protein RadA [Acidimicrobiia bacterium]|nr:DNA repair protein RadA [Acidimicrobiia bacterium]MBT8193458.1 DNA repair protein RadA [Acidimicrobiia bacterium]NNF88945.1 DNA repair protein RadA [Acidimicrobiia bacterium]NNJ48496.1 DNA repair protein RadA [Acidimicrobiia bacterium]NNL13753.1 DNA repair protein RadA [Acidimicrobiia bacterium]
MSYRCNGCGFASGKWMGFCPQCRAPEPLEEVAGRATRTAPVRVAGRGEARIASGTEEFDRVLGGGMVAGSSILVGGEPGIGKSTLLLQLAAGFSGGGHDVLIATAEESVDQVAMRADRLDCSGVSVVAVSEVEAIIEMAGAAGVAAVVVDSIQTVSVGDGTGVPGGVTQVRESAQRLVRFGKESGISVILVGHVTKDGTLAGPKQLEHLVDVVLALEGEAELGLRVLRSQKNRFGATHQVGLFQMTDRGMKEVTEPLLDSWRGDVAGTVAFAGMEGRRSILVEIQALVAPASTPQPRRSVKGLEVARLHQILAVLERHGGASFAGLDVYVNVTAGLRIREPAADLPVALALVSSLLDVPLGRLAAWGEVGLTGEVRTVSASNHRREEAVRAGLGVVAPGSERGRIEALLATAGLPISKQDPVVASGTDGHPHAFVTPRGVATTGARH